MRIKSSDYVVNNGELFFRQTLTCRKKGCPNYNQDVKSIYMPLTVVPDNDAKSDSGHMSGDGTITEETPETTEEVKEESTEVASEEPTEEVTEETTKE